MDLVQTLADAVISLFIAVSENFRIQDFFDIVIISVLIYILLIWFKNTASRFVFGGIILLGVIYLLARLFHLYLTSMLLQGFFTILLIALVVIFQEEIRRFFERLATWGSLRKRREEEANPYHLDMEIIVESAGELAVNMTGALIVLQGKDPLERHLKGGYVLDGCLSQPLLASIFDVHSAGHDGAVVIDKGRVLKFGCHLPLSLDASISGKLGLRHTAALGLSEKSDALCIVVSEERGTISVAHEGGLSQIPNTSKLSGMLEQFYESRSPVEKANPFAHWIRKNTGVKAVAVLLALVLWFAFGYQRDWVQRDFMVPIEYRSIPEAWYIEEPKIFQAKVALTGSVQAFNLFDPSNLNISLDLANVQEGSQDIAITGNLIHVPSNLTLAKVQPSKIKIVAYRLFPINLPVYVNKVGTLPDNIVLKDILISPGSVRVQAPSKLIKKKVAISTESIDLSGITETTTLEPKLILPPEIRFQNEVVPRVSVTIQVESKKKIRK